MNDTDRYLRDQLALSELDPNSAAYRQMRLSQLHGRFKDRKGKPEGENEKQAELQSLIESDEAYSITGHLSDDTCDLFIDMVEAYENEAVAEGDELLQDIDADEEEMRKPSQI